MHDRGRCVAAGRNGPLGADPTLRIGPRTPTGARESRAVGAARSRASSESTTLTSSSRRIRATHPGAHCSESRAADRAGSETLPRVPADGLPTQGRRKSAANRSRRRDDDLRHAKREKRLALDSPARQPAPQDVEIKLRLPAYNVDPTKPRSCGVTLAHTPGDQVHDGTTYLGAPRQRHGGPIPTKQELLCRVSSQAEMLDSLRAATPKRRVDVFLPERRVPFDVDNGPAAVPHRRD